MATTAKPEPAARMPAEQVQAISRALSDPRRFQILQQIASQVCSPCSELRESFPISAATMSHHLKELEGAGLVKTSRRGKFVDTTFCRDAWESYVAELGRI